MEEKHNEGSRVYNQRVKREPEELGGVPMLSAVIVSTVLRKKSGLPAKVLAWLVLLLLQPSAVSRNRV